MTGIPSVYLCVSAKVNSEQLLHSVNTLHEKQVCIWSQELRGPSPSPEHEEWHWTIFEIQLNLCWTGCIWMQTDYTRSQLSPEHTRAIHEGISRADGDTRRVYKHAQEMMNVAVSPDYPGKLVIDSLGYVCSTTLYSKGFFCCSFCGSP